MPSAAVTKMRVTKRATWLRCVIVTSKIRLINIVGKMMFLLNSKPVDALALIVHRSAQDKVGRAWVKKLREPLPECDLIAD